MAPRRLQQGDGVDDTRPIVQWQGIVRDSATQGALGARGIEFDRAGQELVEVLERHRAIERSDDLRGLVASDARGHVDDDRGSHELWSMK